MSARASLPLPRKRWVRRGLAAAGAVAALVGVIAAADRLLPPDLSRYQNQGAVVTDSAGEALRLFAASDGVWRLQAEPEDVDPRYLELLIAYEDKRFGDHAGIDPLAVARAAWLNLTAGRVVSGASTLTMQVARLLQPHRRGWGGKVVESLRALQLERRYAKREILAMYLTLAPYGGNVEGVRMASRLYFGKEPQNLTLAESALLIALPQSPERRRPDRYADAAAEGRDHVLHRLMERGAITAEDEQHAAEAAVPMARLAQPFLAPHLAERLAHAAPDRAAALRTTIDGPLQRNVEALVRRESAWYADPAEIAVMVLDVPTRRVRAYVSGDAFTAPQGQIDLVRVVRSPGSALKPFIYGMAFERKLSHPETSITDRPMRFGSFLPRNFDRSFQGRVTLREALQSSLNVPAVAVLDRLGPENFLRALDDAGVHMVLPDGSAPGLAVALGGIGATLDQLVMLYAALADDGTVSPNILLDDAVPVSRRPLLDRAAIAEITEILGAAPPPPGMMASGAGEKRRIAFKTGTSYGFRDAWAIGYTARHVVGVWVGRPDGSPRPGAYGRDTAAPILFQAFDLLDGPEASAPRLADARAASRWNRLSPPAALASFERGADATASAGPRILFPAPNTELLRPAPTAAQDDTALIFEAAGGAAPLRWYVDGAPLDTESPGRRAEWQPDGPGFIRVSVVDALGRNAAVRVRIVEAR